ncbi:MAG: hypothetical protein Q6J68_04155 [Thermostichales cyanobacterium SZTDM-1c_bins_54]
MAASQSSPSARLLVLGALGLGLLFTPVADAQPAPSLWSGSGQILSGQGQGATVELVLETSPGRIRSHAGPALDAPFVEPTSTIRQGDALWQIEMQGNLMIVTVYRGSQIIRYQLQPEPITTGSRSKPLPYTQPAAPMATFAPVMQELISVPTLAPLP